MKFISKILLLTLFLTSGFGYRGQGKTDYVSWSATQKLSVNDFGIRTGEHESTSSFGQFTIEYQINGFDFLSKNFNKKVRNLFIRTASWIDTTADLAQALTYQQTLFDIAEIYARQFRKALRENRKKIAKGPKIAEELNAQFMAAFAKRRIEYDRETKFGTDTQEQRKWELQIQNELAELMAFSYQK